MTAHKMLQSDDDHGDRERVNHPSHYQHPSGVEAITICEHHNFNVGNAMKYLFRAGLKDNTPAVEDLEKCAWYVNREIQRLKGAAK